MFLIYSTFFGHFRIMTSAQWRIIKTEKDGGYVAPRGRKCGICTIIFRGTWVLPEGPIL